MIKNDKNNLKNRLRGKAGKGDNAINNEINKLMHELPPSLIPDLYRTFQVVAPIASRNLLPYRRDSFNNMFPVALAPPSSVAAEMTWAFSVIKDKAIEINQFIKHREIIEQQVLVGAYDLALENLNELENEHGKSVWGIELRFALIQEQSGLKGNGCNVSSSFSRSTAQNEATLSSTNT